LDGFIGGFMDYETMCKYVGQLFLESRHHAAGIELKINQLLIENSKLKKQIADSQTSNGTKEERSDS
jgi:hypothetical protein